MNQLIAAMISNLHSAEASINWTDALNPTDANYEAYNEAAGYLIEPDIAMTESQREALVDELDEYNMLNAHIAKWKTMIKFQLKANGVAPEWLALVDVIEEHGY